MTKEPSLAETVDQDSQYRRRKSLLRGIARWFRLAVLTFTDRRLSSAAHAILANRPEDVLGLENVPTEGAFVLALNHFRVRGGSLDLLAAVVRSLELRRPDAVDRMLIIAGKRQRVKRTVLRWLYNQFVRLWSDNLVRIPLGNNAQSIRSLRDWRQLGTSRPSVVFPEGTARLRFGKVRPGSARWLSAMKVPTIPVGVWWQNGAWHVRFGEPIPWVSHREKCDAQLGLCIARLLPGDLAPDWQPLLQRCRELPMSKPEVAPITAATAQVPTW